ncbi:Alpha/Beta hydrolase protein [Obelidium mucronatum]|nr:Alpha/Beta hydrolase protein [Obelidium mucronatum]
MESQIDRIQQALEETLPLLRSLVFQNETEFICIGAVAIVILLYVVLIPSPVKIIHSPNTVLIASRDKKGRSSRIPLATLLYNKCPSLAKGRFWPTPWLPFGDMQTIYAGLISKFPEMRADYDRQLMDMPDGGLVAVDWAPKDHKSMPATTPILIILHGLAGGSRETYICDLVPYALKSGYKVAALNYRGCGGVEITTPQLYSGSFTEDIRLMTQFIAKKYPMAPLVGIGFSLGANIMMKAIGEDSEESPLIGCVSIANPYDLHLGLTLLHSTWFGKNVYSKIMTSSLIGVFKKHRNTFEKNSSHPQYIEPIDSSQIMKAKFLPEFDEAVTRRVFGYRTVSEYYRMGSSAQYLPDVAIPTLLLSDVNDPIAVSGSIPLADVLGNPYIILATTQRGGHIGWFEGLFFPKRWFPKPVMEFVKALIDAHESLPPHQKHLFATAKIPARKNHIHHGKHATIFRHQKREDEKHAPMPSTPSHTAPSKPTVKIAASQIIGNNTVKLSQKVRPAYFGILSFVQQFIGYGRVLEGKTVETLMARRFFFIVMATCAYLWRKKGRYTSFTKAVGVASGRKLVQ